MEDGFKLQHSDFFCCFELGGTWLKNICLTAVQIDGVLLVCLFSDLISVRKLANKLHQQKRTTEKC